MADNVSITAGSGTSIATDDIGGVHYQINKLAFGPLNTATLVETSAGLPVDVKNTSIAVTGPLTDTQLRATAVPVSLSSTTISGTVTTTVSGSVAVTGTFWQATQPVSIAGTVAVSGPLTDAQLRATAVPVSGPLTDTQLRAAPIAVSGITAASPEASATFRGRASTFRTPGRAGTTGQKLLALHNASGSTKIVHINQLTVDLYQTVVKAVTVAPPVIRVHRFTAVPTNGTALGKVSKDTSLSSASSITVWGDASADGTGSATTLTVTIPADSTLTQVFSPRTITAVGYEMIDRAELLENRDVVLRAGEGIVVFLSYTLATQNPVTDMWIATVDWYEV